jgi:hypothetical protein
MILADTDILSALAKVARLPLLFSLFQTTELDITPGVFREVEHSFNLGREYADDGRWTMDRSPWSIVRGPSKGTGFFSQMSHEWLITADNMGSCVSDFRISFGRCGSKGLFQNKRSETSSAICRSKTGCNSNNLLWMPSLLIEVSSDYRVIGDHDWSCTIESVADSVQQRQ